MANKPKVARAIFPNAGVEAWYRTALENAITDMARSVSAAVRDAWKDAGFAMDSITPIHAAGVMFRAPDGRVLLLHRTDGQGWAWPAGGVDPGEDPEGAARREAGEETGWSAGTPLSLLEVRIARGVEFFTYVADVPATFVPMLNHEHDTYRWTTPDYAMQVMPLHSGVHATLLEQRFPNAYDARPTGAELLRRAMEKWGRIWVGKLDDLSLDLSTKFADKNFSATQSAMKASFKAAGLTVKFKPTVGSKNAYQAVISENVNLIRSIPQQYLKDVQSQVWQSVMKGSDLATLSKGIQAKYEVAFKRAALIARDQNNKAKAVIEDTRRKELGFKEAFWQHSSAGKVPRPEHVEMNGKRYKLEQGMWDKVEGEYVWPGQLINCRCTSSAILPGYND